MCIQIITLIIRVHIKSIYIDNIYKENSECWYDMPVGKATILA